MSEKDDNMTRWVSFHRKTFQQQTPADGIMIAGICHDLLIVKLWLVNCCNSRCIHTSRASIGIGNRYEIIDAVWTSLHQWEIAKREQEACKEIVFIFKGKDSGNCFIIVTTTVRPWKSSEPHELLQKKTLF